MTKNLKYYKSEDFKYSGNKILLTPINEEHVEPCINWLADPEINKFLSNNIKNVTREQELEWLEFIKESETDLVFAMLDKLSGSYIGNCGLHKIETINKTCEFGIFIGDRKYWNRGFGTDAVKTMLDFALNELKLCTVRLMVYEYNYRAIQVYKKCGFYLVHTLKKNHFYNDIYWDEFIMEYRLFDEILKFDNMSKI